MKWISPLMWRTCKPKCHPMTDFNPSTGGFFCHRRHYCGQQSGFNLYQHINSPEARMYLGRQLYEEMLHVQFYLTLLDTYIPDPEERAKAFSAITEVPSIKRKADFSFKWMDTIFNVKRLDTRDHKKAFLRNLICFAGAIEGLFFFAAFTYVYFLRSKGLLNGLASGTNWVFRDESCHIDFAFQVIDIIREEEPYLFDSHLRDNIVAMFHEAIDCEMSFGTDILQAGAQRTESKGYEILSGICG